MSLDFGADVSFAPMAADPWVATPVVSPVAPSARLVFAGMILVLDAHETTYCNQW